MAYLESNPKRAVCFFDGQNLFYGAKESFGSKFPDYDPLKLAQAICLQKDFHLADVYFYTGIPQLQDKPFWHHFWTAKLAAMGTRGVHTFSRPLRYRNQVVSLPNGQNSSILVGQEKGIDIRIALDVVRLARQQAYDVAIIFSQDQDLSELSPEIRAISNNQQRWIKLASAFPFSPTTRNTRGINGTDWIQIDRTTYDACKDPNDYRPKPT